MQRELVRYGHILIDKEYVDSGKFVRVRLISLNGHKYILKQINGEAEIMEVKHG